MTADERSWIDRRIERSARQLARRTSRRTLLARLGVALVGLVLRMRFEIPLKSE